VLFYLFNIFKFTLDGLLDGLYFEENTNSFDLTIGANELAVGLGDLLLSIDFILSCISMLSLRMLDADS